MSAPTEIADSLAAFRGDYPEPERTGFLMMRLGDTQTHGRITEAIRDTARAHSLRVVRADDHEYHGDLYWNVLTYVYGSGFGIAVFERLKSDDFNPNVAHEVGYMDGLRRPVCLLKDQTLQALHTDLLGKLYKAFDTQDPEGTIPGVLEPWLRDYRII